MLFSRKESLFTSVVLDLAGTFFRYRTPKEFCGQKFPINTEIKSDFIFIFGHTIPLIVHRYLKWEVDTGLMWHLNHTNATYWIINSISWWSWASALSGTTKCFRIWYIWRCVHLKKQKKQLIAALLVPLAQIIIILCVKWGRTES